MKRHTFLNMLFNVLIINEKSAQRDADTARALAVFPPARCHKPTDRTDYNALRRS